LSEPESVTFELPDDAYRLIKDAHLLSAGAKAAIMTARPSQFREREVSCSPNIAAEILAWFNDYEKHADLMRQFRWEVPVCRRAATVIGEAPTKHMKKESS
jgi:hypothetical protein